MFEIQDSSGLRIVYARDTAGQAIDVIVKRLAGRGRFPADPRETWLKLRDEFGLRVVEIELPPNPR